MNCCDDYGNCTQGRDCPARAKPIRRTDPGIEGVITIARNGRWSRAPLVCCSLWSKRSKTVTARGRSNKHFMSMKPSARTASENRHD